jgi:hypothetical protein
LLNSPFAQKWKLEKGVITMPEEKVKEYAQRVGYNDNEIDMFRESGHRLRHIDRLSEAARLYSIVAEVVEARHCNSGHTVGQKLVLDVDGNFITKLCPSKICVYLASQLTIPVALINERLSEKLEPNDFHFMRSVRCPDAGVECLGYGEVKLKVEVIPREKI